jgi:hypothetical protein
VAEQRRNAAALPASPPARAATRRGAVRDRVALPPPANDNRLPLSTLLLRAAIAALAVTAVAWLGLRLL